MIELTSSQAQAIKFLDAGYNVFLTGKAGTGKSFLVDYFVAKHPEKNVVKCAPTGVAALNIGGSTIHRTFGVPLGVLDHHSVCTSQEKLDVLRKSDVILIDEISMCRIDVFEHVIRSLKRVGINNKQLILVGDFYQLPPVLTPAATFAFQQLYEDKLYAFESDMWIGSNLFTVELKEPKRQSETTEGSLLRSLSNIREGIPDFGIFHIANHADDNAVSLCPTKRQAKQINDEHLGRLPNHKHYLASKTGKVEDTDMVTDEDLVIAKDARIIMLVNDTSKRWVNGSMGTVTDLSDTHITIQIDNEGEYKVEPYTWSIREYVLEEDEETKEKHIVDKEIGSFTQFPLKLAWAITIHKSQGQTYDKVNIYNGFFAEGQMYVALSRCKTLNGIHTMGSLISSQLLCSSAVKTFMTKSIQKSNLIVTQIIEEIRRQKIEKVRAYVDNATLQKKQLYNVLSQIKDTGNQISQSDTTDVIRPLVQFIKKEKEKVANYYNKVEEILKKAKNDAIGYEQEDEMANLLVDIGGVLSQIKFIDADINNILEDAVKMLQKVQKQEEYSRKINKVSDCRNEITSLTTLTHNKIAQILEARSLFSADNKSNAIQPYINDIQKYYENVTNNYTRGNRLLQTAKKEATGFERDDKMAQLLVEISVSLKQIEEDNVVAQRIASDASQVLKLVQQKERKWKLSMAIAILIVLIAITALVIIRY